jgi:hypothetical protein
MSIICFAHREGQRQSAAHRHALREVSFEKSQLVRRLLRMPAGAGEVGQADVLVEVQATGAQVASLERDEGQVL